MQDLQTYDNNEARSFGFAYGLLVGTALGAAVALLFAPKPGSELRGQLADATSRVYAGSLIVQGQALVCGVRWD